MSEFNDFPLGYKYYFHFDVFNVALMTFFMFLGVTWLNAVGITALGFPSAINEGLLIYGICVLGVHVYILVLCITQKRGFF